MKVSKETVEKRPYEIIAACRKLYDRMPMKDITVKDISLEADVSRPTIYNYFKTKEEIFLALLEDEYRLWGKALENILGGKDGLSPMDFADAIAASLEGRDRLLKILSLNLYEIEDNSSLECLISFKKQFQSVSEYLKTALGKFFPTLSQAERHDFVYELFFFMYGIYPYIHPTDKQQAAMKAVGMEASNTTATEMTRKYIMDLLDKTETPKGGKI